jgi:drug/metabolite transporter (DMT)-like permease
VLANSPDSRGSRPSAGSETQAQALVLGNALACLATLPWALPLPAVSAGDLAGLAYLGVFQLGVAYALLGRGLVHVGALQASLLLLLEPALNPVWSWLWHGERPGPFTLAAGAVILAATAAHALARPRA